MQENRTQKTLTWIGHASFLMQVDGINILTDPHLTKRASPVVFAGPSRTTPPGLDIDDLPEIDVIVISHNHYDHLDYQTILNITRKQINALLDKYSKETLKHLNKLKHHACYNEMLNLIAYLKEK